MSGGRAQPKNRERTRSKAQGGPHSKLKNAIELKMKKPPYERPHKETHFISRHSIDVLLNDASLGLRNCLQSDLHRQRGSAPSGPMIEGLQSFVKEKAKKLYTILLLICETQRIVALEEADITDEVFEDIHDGYGPYCSWQYLQGSAHFNDIAETVFTMQWVIPPVFQDKHHQKYDPEWFQEFRFPFITKPEAIGVGSYGDVSAVEVATGHLEAESHDPMSSNLVAYKSVRKGHETTWDKMLKERETLRARKHRYIIPLLASLSTGPENPPFKGDKTEYLHMLFSYTDGGDMNDWLENKSAPHGLADKEARYKFVYETLQGLASGVAFIHSEIDDQIAFHHDLKPSNILLFRGSPDIWKICDFGQANLKDRDGTSGTAQTNDKRFGTYVYRPPEYFVRAEDGNGLKHGRPFDVYSLGCVFLNLITIQKFGWVETGLGYQEFKERRAANKEHVYDGPDKRTPDYSFHNNFGVVKSWIKVLEAGEVSKTFLEVIGLISDMLRPKDQRMFAWEVDQYLYELLNPNNGEEEFKRRLKGVVQRSKVSINRLDDMHNPLQRAHLKEKCWWYGILKDHKWSNWTPQPTKELQALEQGKAEHYSTLTHFPYTYEFKRNQLFGRHDLDEKIAEGFKGSTVVGLHGISGVGKSHLAYHYAVRFRDTSSDAQKKHTFWVDAGSRSKFRSAMRKICIAVEAEVTEPEYVINTAKEWLLDSRNGPWIMVIDGLDDDELIPTLKPFLTEVRLTFHGEIIVTTRNRALLLKHFSLKDGDACLRVEKLAQEETFSMFLWHNNAVALDDKMRDLLAKLSLPVAIKWVAEYMNLNEIATLTMQDLTEAAGNPDETMYELFKEMLKPLTPRSALLVSDKRSLSEWPKLKLLGELSCLNHANIELDVIQQQYKNKMVLLEMLGALKNCSFISKGADDDKYFMHELVQWAVRHWIQNNLGKVELLQLHGEALCMLFCLYKNEKPQTNKIRRSSYLWKLRFMPHFDRFLAFVKASNEKEFTGFHFEQRMAESAITFCQVYLDEGRFDDATCILEFTHKLYRGSRHRYELVRLLVKAYTIRPLARAITWERWNTAEQLLQKSILECEEQHESKEKYLCSLELIDLYTRFRLPKKALHELSSLRLFKLRFLAGKPRLPEINGLEKNIARQISIRRSIEEAKAHLSSAKGSKANTHWEKKHREEKLQKALSCFDEAQTALEEWFHQEKQWTEIENGIADVHCEMGKFKDAEETLKSQLNRLRDRCNAPDRSWSQKRLWDIECRIACIRLKRNIDEDFNERAINKLREVLGHYGRCYGDDNEHTRNCALLLKDALGLDRKEAEDIRKRYGLDRVRYELQLVDDGHDGNTLKILRRIAYFIILLICLGLACLPLFKGLQNGLVRIEL